jgi:hypothetical protein
MVWVGPPLFCSPFGSSPAGVLFRSPELFRNVEQLLSSGRLYPSEIAKLLVEREQFPALFAKMVLFSVSVAPELLLIFAPLPTEPPPRELPDTVLWVSVSLPPFKIPPPLGLCRLSTLAELPDTVLSISVSVPPLSMPPP